MTYILDPAESSKKKKMTKYPRLLFGDADPSSISEAESPPCLMRAQKLN
jgi:hypothetical protein